MEAGETRLLVDAGLGPRTLAERLRAAGVDPASLTAVLLSHEHNDHARGASLFCRRWGVPWIATPGTALASGLKAAGVAGGGAIEPGVSREIGGVRVTGVPVPHDAAEPVAFVITYGEWSLGHATDLGCVTPALVDALRGCHTVLIESNYDPGMLRDGPYPWRLKERILSPLGHLSNQDAARYLVQGLGESCRTVMLAHLSQNNNYPEVARACAEIALRSAGRTGIELRVAGRRGSDWVEVSPADGGAEAREQFRLF